MTAPTSPAVAMADLLEYLDDGGLHFEGTPLPEAAAAELRRLQAENERLQGSLDAQRLISDRAIALAKELEARKPLPLSYRSGVMTSSIDGGATVSLHFNDMAEAEAWFVAITDQHDAGLVDKSPNLHEPLVDKTANLQDRPAPLSDEQIDDLHGEANRGFDIGRDEYFKAFRDAERAHGIKET